MGFLLVLLFLSLSLLSPGDMFPGIDSYRPLLVVLAMTTVASVLPLLGTPVVATMRTSMTMAMMFIAVVGFSRIMQGWFGGAFLAVEALLSDVSLFFFALIHFRSVKRLQAVRVVLVLVALYVVAMGISEIKVVRATGTETPYVLGGVSAAGALTVRLRGLGLLHDPNHLGQLLVALLPLLAVAHPARGKLKRSWWIYPVGAALLTGIYLTNSRGTLLATLLFCGLLLAGRYRKLGMVLSAVFLPLGVLIINATRERGIAVTSGVDRLVIWSDGLSYVKHSPIWGIGYNSFAEWQGMTAHNSFLLCAAELGLLGLFFWMGLIVVITLQLRKVSEMADSGGGDPALGQWATGIRRALYVYLLASFFLSRTYNMPLYLLLGMGAAVIAMAGGEYKLRINSRWPAWALGLGIGSIAFTYILVRMRAV
jgi:putative inorganic carbon (HCO3(-)) transporter